MVFMSRRLRSLGWGAFRFTTDMPCNRGLVKFIGLPFNDPDGVTRAFAEAGPETVAEVVGGEHRLSIDYFYGPFRA
jgi:hypothetical protein